MSIANGINKKLFLWGISIFVAILGYFLPLGDIYTFEMKKFVFITILGLCMLCFEIANNWVIAMFMPLAWVLCGCTDFATAFGSTYGSLNFIMLLNAFLFAALLSKTGLMDRIGYGLIVKSGGTYSSAVWALFLVGFVISAVSMLMNFILTVTIGLAMMNAMGIKKEDKAGIPIFAAIVITCTAAKVVLYSPISISIINASVQTVIPDYLFTYANLFIYGWPMMIMLLFFQWLTIKWYLYHEKKENHNYDVQAAKAVYRSKYESLGRMSNQEKIGAVALIFLFGWMFLQTFHVLNMDIAYAFLIANIFLFLTGVSNESVLRDVNLSSVALIMAFVAVGNVANALQLTSIISSGVTALFGGMSNYWSPIGTMIFGIGANLILSPYAMMSMLPAVVVDYAVNIGWSWMPHFLSCYLASDMVFFPYEYPAIMIMFGFGFCTMKNAIKMLTAKLILSSYFLLRL